jgi:hypothetical protein
MGCRFSALGRGRIAAALHSSSLPSHVFTPFTRVSHVFTPFTCTFTGGRKCLKKLELFYFLQPPAPPQCLASKCSALTLCAQDNDKHAAHKRGRLLVRTCIPAQGMRDGKRSSHTNTIPLFFTSTGLPNLLFNSELRQVQAPYGCPSGPISAQSFDVSRLTVD